MAAGTLGSGSSGRQSFSRYELIGGPLDGDTMSFVGVPPFKITVPIPHAQSDFRFARYFLNTKDQYLFLDYTKTSR